MARKKGITPPKLKRLTPRVDDELHEEFMAIASSVRIPAAELCRQFLREFIAQKSKTPVAE